jgi:hypothetical protein
MLEIKGLVKIFIMNQADGITIEVRDYTKTGRY